MKEAQDRLLALKRQAAELIPLSYILGDPLDKREYRLCRCYQRDGSSLWAIRDAFGLTLNKDGMWEHEPLPSSRDGNYIMRNRYDSIEDALAIWNRWEASDDKLGVPGFPPEKEGQINE